VTAGSEPGARFADRHWLWAALIDELPYGAIIVLALVGISWTSVSSSGTTVYWVILTPVLAVICIAAGWRHTVSGQRVAMAITQVLQWAAVLAAMWLMQISDENAVLNSNETGLVLLTLLALGVFVSGLNLRSWKLCVTGAFLAVCVPVVAWVEHAALLLLLVGLGLIGLGLLYWWYSSRRGRAGAPSPA
jgi:hypothetical protein